jgi:hypothetical protein
MSKAKASVKKLKPINRQLVTVRIVGISPLITHKWDEKAKEMMRAKQQSGKKTKARELRDPEAEGQAAMYLTDDGNPGILAIAIKSSVIEAAHNDLGIPKTLVRKALFVYPMGRDIVLPLETPSGKGKVEPVFEEDMVRVGQGSADLRYRPYYYEWAVTTQWSLDADQLQVEDLLTLIDRAGFGVGVCEWRPEKNGEFGRFEIDPKFKVQVQSNG